MAANKPPAEEDLDAALKSAKEGALGLAKKELATLESNRFSPQAIETLVSKVSSYVSELVDESDKLAKRQGADSVSAKNVEHANDILMTDHPRKLYRHFGTIGGLLLGTGLSTVMSIAMGEFNAMMMLVSVGLIAIGAFLTAFHIAKD